MIMESDGLSANDGQQTIDWSVDGAEKDYLVELIDFCERRN